MRRSRSSQLYGTVGAAIPQRCDYAWACSSGGQSRGFLNLVPQVRVLPGPPAICKSPPASLPPKWPPPPVVRTQARTPARPVPTKERAKEASKPDPVNPRHFMYVYDNDN